MIIPRLPQKASDQNGCGALKLTLTVWLSSLSIRQISRYEPLVHAAGRQRRGGEGSGEPERDHGGDERAAGEPTGPDVLEELAKLPFVHGERPPRSALPWQRSRAPHRALSMRTATSSASTMLSWFAMPFHARSNAVPWSTETRRNGSPTVTLTPESPTHRLVASS